MDLWTWLMVFGTAAVIVGMYIFFYASGENASPLTWSVDLLAAVALLLYFLAQLYTHQLEKRWLSMEAWIESLEKLEKKGTLILAVGALIVLHLIPPTRPFSVEVTIQILWLVAIMSGVEQVAKYLFGFSCLEYVRTWLREIFQEETKKRDIINEIEQSAGPEEVFHVSNQLYTYNEAREVCEIFGAKLATKEQMLAAWKGGADWNGSKGWCEDQESWYPKQKSDTCPLSGLFGGKEDDPDALLGVNCFGIKPTASDKELAAMAWANSNLNPLSAVKLIYAERKKSDFLNISPFNLKKWSRTAAPTTPPTSQ